nr:SUMF1/EgtB/PvdO family nonheme iron enzyme [Lentibacter algarum]
MVACFVGFALFLSRPDTVASPGFQTQEVTLKNGRTLAVQTREVTVAQWQACHRAGKCTLEIPAQKAEDDYPATGISYPDAMQYLNWINASSQTAWRLPTAAEWQELATEVMPEEPDPIFTDPSLTWASTYLTDANRTSRALRPSGSFASTSTGVQDLSGNVWEWTSDCYAGASDQGAEIDITRCPAYIMGGEHEAVMSYLIRDPARGGCAVGAPPAHLGMRLVADVS